MHNYIINRPTPTFEIVEFYLTISPYSNLFLLHTPPKSYCTRRPRVIAHAANELLHTPPTSYCTRRQRVIVHAANELLHTPPTSYCTRCQRVIVHAANELPDRRF